MNSLWKQIDSLLESDLESFDYMNIGRRHRDRTSSRPRPPSGQSTLGTDPQSGIKRRQNGDQSVFRKER